MTKQSFEKKFWEIWFQDQTEAEKKVKWLPSKRPAQVAEEYLEYLWIVSSVKNPTVLEIGVKDGHQKRFYEQLLNCSRYDGVDTSYAADATTIVGASQWPSVIAELKEREPDGYNIIFIDGNHSREVARADYETYKEMVRVPGFLVLHDIHHDHWEGVDGAAVLWEEIRDKYPVAVGIYHETDYLPYQKGTSVRKKAGIGVIPIP